MKTIAEKRDELHREIEKLCDENDRLREALSKITCSKVACLCEKKTGKIDATCWHGIARLALTGGQQ